MANFGQFLLNLSQSMTFGAVKDFCQALDIPGGTADGILSDPKTAANTLLTWMSSHSDPRNANDTSPFFKNKNDIAKLKLLCEDAGRADVLDFVDNYYIDTDDVYLPQATNHTPVSFVPQQQPQAPTDWKTKNLLCFIKKYPKIDPKQEQPLSEVFYALQNFFDGVKNQARQKTFIKNALLLTPPCFVGVVCDKFAGRVVGMLTVNRFLEIAHCNSSNTLSKIATKIERALVDKNAHEIREVIKKLDDETQVQKWFSRAFKKAETPVDAEMLQEIVNCFADAKIKTEVEIKILSTDPGLNFLNDPGVIQKLGVVQKALIRLAFQTMFKPDK